MKNKNFKTKAIGPVLLLIPMACMHLGDGHHDDGHHSGDHHSSIRQSSYQSSTYVLCSEQAPEIQYFSPKNEAFILFTY